MSAGFDTQKELFFVFSAESNTAHQSGSVYILFKLLIYDNGSTRILLPSKIFSYILFGFL